MKAPKIIEKYGATCTSPRKGAKPAWVVVHYTGTANASAEAIARGFSRKNASTSAHYVVDGSSIYMCVDESKAAWHVCDGQPDSRYAGVRHAEQWHAAVDPIHKFRGNRNSIAVELCVKKENTASKRVEDLDWVIPQEELELAADLIAWICARRGISTRRVLRHYDATGKNCPRPLVTMPRDPDDSRDELWCEFKRMIARRLNDANA